jgi:hypothetical protein
MPQEIDERELSNILEGHDEEWGRKGKHTVVDEDGETWLTIEDTKDGCTEEYNHREEVKRIFDKKGFLRLKQDLKKTLSIKYSFDNDKSFGSVSVTKQEDPTEEFAFRIKCGEESTAFFLPIEHHSNQKPGGKPSDWIDFAIEVAMNRKISPFLLIAQERDEYGETHPQKVFGATIENGEMKVEIGYKGKEDPSDPRLISTSLAELSGMTYKLENLNKKDNIKIKEGDYLFKREEKNRYKSHGEEIILSRKIIDGIFNGEKFEIKYWHKEETNKLTKTGISLKVNPRGREISSTELSAEIENGAGTLLGDYKKLGDKDEWVKACHENLKYNELAQLFNKLDYIAIPFNEKK